MKGINHTMKPAICRHRYACIACCIRNTVPYNHQNYCYPLSNMNPRYALSVWLAGWLAGWQKHTLPLFPRASFLSYKTHRSENLTPSTLQPTT